MDNFEIVQRNKKRKERNSPNIANTPSYADRAKQLKAPVVVAKPAMTMIGKAASSAALIKPLKTVTVKKAVYCLNNIDSVYSETDVVDYIKSIDVRIFNCFELPTSPNQSMDSKSFRICIVDENKSKHLDTDSWAVGITICNWVWKGEKRIKINYNACDPTRRRTEWILVMWLLSIPSQYLR